MCVGSDASASLQLVAHSGRPSHRRLAILDLITSRAQTATASDTSKALEIGTRLGNSCSIRLSYGTARGAILHRSLPRHTRNLAPYNWPPFSQRLARRALEQEHPCRLSRGGRVAASASVCSRAPRSGVNTQVDARLPVSRNIPANSAAWADLASFVNLRLSAPI
jgi:hypothetical protein